MKIELNFIKIRDLVAGFRESADDGVFGYGGKLNIRPPYQREFRYNENQQKKVIETIRKKFPLNIMYWSKESDGTYEMIDGQQRTLSICGFVNHDFNIYDTDRGVIYFDGLTQGEQDEFLDYELMVYICEGTLPEKLEWFRVINIAGEKLLDQELLNAIYTGPFVSDARRYFSKTGCAAYRLANKYINGVPIEQAYLAKALQWAAHRDKTNVETYMAMHKLDQNANGLWLYFQQIIAWVQATFTNYRREMKGLNWGEMYEKFGQNSYNTDELEQQIHSLMEDNEIMKKAGIYRYVLSGDIRDLSFRAFDDKQKREAYERQEGICPHCGGQFNISDMEGDHITPWSEGGTTTADNCQMLCRRCNRLKGAK